MVQSEDPIYRITAQPTDALADLLARVRNHAGRPVYLTVPNHSPLFLTASEFRALRETVRSNGINLTLISDDAHRRDYGQLFNLVTAEQEPAQQPTPPLIAPVPAPPPGQHAIDPALGAARQRRPLGSRLRDEPGSSPETAQEQPHAWGGAWQTTPPPPDTGSPSQGGWPAHGAEPTAFATASPAMTTALVPVIEPPKPQRRRRWPWFAAICLLLVLGLAAAGLLVPKATVTLMRERTPLATDVTFKVIAPGTVNTGAGAAFVVDGIEQQADVTVSVTVPATGQANVPDQPSHGQITFANPTAQPITLPEGTNITSDGGLVFTLVAEVTVPAATGDVSGNATGEIASEQGGTVSNLGQGALSGRLEQGVYFSNREAALSGGTDIAAMVVSEADIATATEQLEASLPAQVAAALSQQTGQPTAVVPSSLQHDPLTPAADVEAGVQASQVTVSATTSVSALTYDPIAALGNISSTASGQLTVAEGTTLDPNSAQVGASIPVEGDTTNSLVTVPVTIDQVTDPDETAIDALKDDIAGKSRGDAEARASAIAGVENAAIEVEPSWLPEQVRDRMPFLPRQIEVIER